MKHFDGRQNAIQSCKQFKVACNYRLRMHVSLYTRIRACMYHCIHAYGHACIIVYKHTCIIVYTHTRTHVFTHACITVYTNTCIPGCMYTAQATAPSAPGARSHPAVATARPPRALLRARELETFVGAGSWSWKLEYEAGAGAENERRSWKLATKIRKRLKDKN